AENVRALAYARAQGSGEAVFANTREELCEATGSNVFVVEGGVVRTPPASSGCLLGVTRALTIELCAALSIPVEERALSIDVLHDADEVFLTSTTREVQPVASVDGHTVGTGSTDSSIGARLASEFRALVARDIDP